MNWLITLQQAIDYMEDHLLETINYEDVAKEVAMSSYNFHRTFTLMAGMTANEYIRNRRLSLAGEELKMTDQKIIEIAYKYGYETPESFAKAFSRFHGVSPRRAKENGVKLCLFNRLVIKLSLEGGRRMEYKIVEAGSKKFVAKVRAFRNETIGDETNHEIPDFWKECHEKQLVERIRELRPDGKKDLFGLCTPTKADDETFDYGIGVILDQDTKAAEEEALKKEGYSIWNVEAGTFGVFSCYGTDGECISNMWSRFYHEFLPQSPYEQTDTTDYEIYFENGEPGLFCELWIPLKKINK